MRMIEVCEDSFWELQDDGIGYCLACGEERDGYTEPDARKYPCTSCGKHQVYGVHSLLMMDRIKILD